MKKRPPPHYVKLVASLTALASLSSALIARVDPVNCLLRGVLGYYVGRALAGLWCALFAVTTVEYNGELEPDSSHADDGEGTKQVAA